MHFTKMNGAGNDFVILDAVEQPLGLAPEDVPGLVCRLCDRHMGIGADGVILLQKAQEVLDTEFPELAKTLELHIPDESSRRVGQSVAAASLPKIK